MRLKNCIRNTISLLLEEINLVVAAQAAGFNKNFITSRGAPSGLSGKD